jgi:selT/selW/selH-like putative selenoprotein
VATQRVGVEATMTPGEKSQFDVRSDGQLVFSKQREGRFPEEQEIVDALR